MSKNFLTIHKYRNKKKTPISLLPKIKRNNCKNKSNNDEKIVNNKTKRKIKLNENFKIISKPNQIMKKFLYSIKAEKKISKLNFNLIFK